MTEFLQACILLLFLALAGVLIGWLRAEGRAAQAEQALARYAISEDEQIASLPRDVRPVPNVDDFLRDVFGSR